MLLAKRASWRDRANKDFARHFEYLAASGGVNVALRSRSALDRALDNLLEMPLAGSLKHSRFKSLNGLRMWPLVGFDEIVIFYLPTANGITIVRILHAKQDYHRHL